MKYEDVRSFVRVGLEYEIAWLVRRQPLVGADEIAKLGSIAFEASDWKIRAAIEHIVRSAALAALGRPLAPNPVTDLETDSALTEKTAIAMRAYAQAVAEGIVKQDAKASEGRAVPALRMGPGGPLPAMHYLSIWKEGGSYVPGDVVTYRGTSWHCGLPTTSKPGTNHDWQMMGKSDRERASA